MPGKMSYADYAKARHAKGGSMSYEDYMKTAKAGGAPFMDEDEYGKAEQDFLAQQPGGGLGKSATGIDADALMKAIGDYETTAEALTTSGGSRESILMARLQEGTISKSEQAELGRLWQGGGDDTANEPMRKSITDRMEEDDPDAAGLVDASDFLKSLVDSTNEAIGEVAGQVERDGMVTRNLLSAQGSLLKSTAHVLAQQSELIKSQQTVISEMGRRLGVLEREPVVRKSQGSDPRDVRSRQPGKSGTSGRGGADDLLTKSQIEQGFRRLLEKADAAGDDAAVDRLVHETSFYESTSQIRPNMAAAIRMELGI